MTLAELKILPHQLMNGGICVAHFLHLSNEKEI